MIASETRSQHLFLFGREHDQRRLTLGPSCHPGHPDPVQVVAILLVPGVKDVAIATARQATDPFHSTVFGTMMPQLQ